MIARLLQLPLFVILLGIVALAMMVPAVHGVLMRDYPVAQGFFYSGTLVLVLTVMIGLATATYAPRNAARSHLATLGAAYVALPIVMALPVLQVLPDTTLLNAWFEMLSAFTTTGATVYDDPARLPDTLHLWRALVGWMGGFFILLAAYSILAPLNLGGTEVISGRAPGRGSGGTMQITKIAEPSERIARNALQLFPIYSGLTVGLWFFLVLSGDPGLVALCHAMGVLSTSGISPLADGPQSSASGFVGEVLMFLALGFALTRRSFPGSIFVDRGVTLLQDPELRLAFVLLAATTALLFSRHWFFSVDLAERPDFASGLAALWGSLFTALSFLTTTGYVSASWDTSLVWSGMAAPGLVLMGLAIIGGGIATTAGGVKLLRVYALFRHSERELERIIHPSSVGGQGMMARRLRREGAYVAWVFFMLFLVSVIVVMAVLTLIGEPFDTALVLTISALTNTGQLASVALADPIPYASLGPATKIALGTAMIVARLETLAILALIAPGNWRR